MSDYRDDRAALHARVAQQEAELARLEAEAAALRTRAQQADVLESEVMRLRGGPEPPPKPNPVRLTAAMAAGVAMAAVILLGTVAFLVGSRPPPVRAVPAAVAPSQDDSPRRPPPHRAPRSREAPRSFEALTCRCGEDAGAGATLAYTPGAVMSFGSSTTHFITWAIARGGESHPLAAGPRTVPASKIEGGAVSLRIACTPDAMVLALDQRVTAWSLDDGHELWGATLPAPVGAVRGGDFAPTCERLSLDAKGNVVVPHAGGKTVLRAKDGAPVR